MDLISNKNLGKYAMGRVHPKYFAYQMVQVGLVGSPPVNNWSTRWVVGRRLEVGCGSVETRGIQPNPVVHGRDQRRSENPLQSGVSSRSSWAQGTRTVGRNLGDKFYAVVEYNQSSSSKFVC